MNYQIKTLTLFQDLCFSKEEKENNESLYIYETKVDKNNLEPELELFLQNEVFCGYKTEINSKDLHEGDYIPVGKYLFVQGVASDFNSFLKASEAVFLEALWQEKEFIDNKVYLRKLLEGEKSVFQVFRQIKS